MNIGIVYRDFDSNVGDAFDVRSIALRLVSQGNVVFIYCSHNRKNEIKDANVIYRRSSSVIEAVKNIYSDRCRLEIVHLFCGLIPSLVPIAMLCRVLKIDYAYSSFGQILPRALAKSRFKKWLYVRLFLESMVSHAKFVHAISEYESLALKKMGARAVVTSPLSIQGYELQCVERSNELNYLTFIGRLDIWHKGLDILIEAVNLSRRFLEDGGIQVVLAGRGGEKEVDDLNQMIESKSLAKLVEVWVDIEEVKKQELLSCTRVFIHPSRVEGFARSMREALNAKIPIVTTFDSNVGDYINMCGVGKACEFSAIALARVLQEVLQSEKDINEENWSSIFSLMTWDRLTSDLSRCYEM